MTPEQQRIAIARECKRLGQAMPTFVDEDGCEQEGMPDYLNDLNAMREAVMAQSRFFQARFSVMLSQRATIQNTFPHALTAQDWADVFFQAQGK